MGGPEENVRGVNKAEGGLRVGQYLPTFGVKRLNSRSR